MTEREKNSKLEELEIDLLLSAVHRYYGYDFRDFEPGTVRLRIREAMLASRVPTISRFQDKLLRKSSLFERFLRSFASANPGMFSDTGFYRAFRTKIVPQLKTYPFVRIWHAGCSTGELVYSVAILLKEEGLYERSRIYATDLSEEVVRQARLGVFRSSVAEQYAADYLEAGGKGSFEDYFTRKGNRLFIDPSLKRNIVFSEHNLATDGSFNEFQVIVCRGVLGGFNNRLRERVDRLIYDSLSRFGILALGPSESLETTPYEDRYQLLDETSRLYQKNGSGQGRKLVGVERKRG